MTLPTSSPLYHIDRPQPKVNGSVNQSGMILLPLFPVIPRRVHGYPCLCCYGFPPTRARYELLRSKHNHVYHSAKYGELHTLPLWEDTEYPPNCSTVVYDRRVYAICDCGDLVAVKFGTYPNAHFTTDHRCKTVA